MVVNIINKCNIKVKGKDKSFFEKDLWTNTDNIKDNIPTCGPNLISIRNKYTKFEQNMYAPKAHKGHDKHEQTCKYHGCVEEDKYRAASLPDTIAPLCQELVNASNYYDKFYVKKPNSLSDLVNNPDKYGCELLKT